MTSPLHRHTGRRLKAATFATAIVAALTLAPAAASFADDIEGPDGPSVVEGTPNDDDISGDNNDSGDIAFVPGDDDVITGGAGDDDIVGDGVASGDIAGSVGDPISGERAGDDTIDGGDGDDFIAGDGYASGAIGGSIVGGHDTIHGGNGDDFIEGDGETGGFVGGVIDGGDDILYGDAGDDVIYGDGFVDSFLGLDVVIGGDDELYGGAGEDYLDGQGGNDLLCGLGGGQENTEADELIGGEGSDLACAVDDDVTAAAGVQDSIMVGLNDEQLDDEGDEDGLLQYTLGAITGGILNAVIDALTGELTFTAECDGTVGYNVTRDDVDASELVTSAVVNIDVTDEAASCNPVIDTPDVDEPETAGAAGTAVLPDTGASGGLNAIGASGLGLLVGGIAVITIASRRKVQPVEVKA